MRPAQKIVIPKLTRPCSCDLQMTRTPKLTVRLSGGLGNQLFQYCAALGVAKRWKCRLAFDTSWYRFSRYRPVRTFQLNRFVIPEADSSSGLAKDFVLTGIDLSAKKSPAAKNLLSQLGIRVLIEENNHEKPEYLYGPLPSASHIILSGFWQTADHFLGVRGEIRQYLQPKFSLSAEAQSLLKVVTDTNSVFLHVRRGDFISLGHPLLPLSYYKSAVREIEERHGTDLQWFIFSDDTGWCRKEFTFLHNPNIISLSSPEASLEEFHIMSQCRHGVIANSSYSWWAAALTDENRGTICAPKSRYGNQGGEEIQRQRVLPWWILVDSENA